MFSNSADPATVLNPKRGKLMQRCRRLRGYLRQSILLLPVTGLLERMRSAGSQHHSYERWIQLCEIPSMNKSRILESIGRFKYKPKISIVMHVCNAPASLLDLAIKSIRDQFYGNWELCISDDASFGGAARAYLESASRQDTRISAIFLRQQSGVAAASNQALRLASGEFVGLLDQRDELSPDALYEVASLLQKHPDADMIYSDEDRLDESGKRTEPFFKPDWSPEYISSCMYACHLGVYRRELLVNIGGFRPGFDGCQDYDVALRISEKTRRIYHIPKIIYHRRIVSGGVKASRAWENAQSIGRRALAEHLSRRGIRGEISDGRYPGHYRVKYEVNVAGKVSIIIPTRDRIRLLAKCITSIEAKTAYPNYEILVVDNQSSEPHSKQYLSSISHRVMPFGEPFNFSRIVNLAAGQCDGDYLLLLNNDTEVISADWIHCLVAFCQQREIGVVGAKLLFGNRRIQHVGIVLGMGWGGIAGHPLRGFKRDTPHYFGFASDAHNCSAVTGACMMIRRQVFEELGGFDENLPIACNDVDFCLRVQQAGYRVVFTPDAELYHYESASRGHVLHTDALAYFRKRWGALLLNDPYYNPNLTLRYEDLGYRVPSLWERQLPEAPNS